jgi:hypothetical protein
MVPAAITVMVAGDRTVILIGRVRRRRTRHAVKRAGVREQEHRDNEQAA